MATKVEWVFDRPNNGGDNGLVLKHPDGQDSRVLSIVKQPCGLITFREECDGYFSIDVTAQDAKRLLQDAIDWIGE